MWKKHGNICSCGPKMVVPRWTETEVQRWQSSYFVSEIEFNATECSFCKPVDQQEEKTKSGKKKLLHTGQLSLITMFHRPIRLSYLRQQGDYLVVGQQTHVHHSGHIADGRKSHTPGPTRSRYWMKTLQNQKAEACRLTIEYCGPQKHETVF